MRVLAPPAVDLFVAFHSIPTEANHSRNDKYTEAATVAERSFFLTVKGLRSVCLMQDTEMRKDLEHCIRKRLSYLSQKS